MLRVKTQKTKQKLLCRRSKRIIWCFIDPMGINKSRRGANTLQALMSDYLFLFVSWKTANCTTTLGSPHRSNSSVVSCSWLFKQGWAGHFWYFSPPPGVTVLPQMEDRSVEITGRVARHNIRALSHNLLGLEIIKGENNWLKWLIT